MDSVLYLIDLNYVGMLRACVCVRLCVCLTFSSFSYGIINSCAYPFCVATLVIAL